MKLNDFEAVLLASQSPRRLDILRSHGVEPIVLPTHTDETLPDPVGMEEAVEMLSAEKALACLSRDDISEYLKDSTLIIAADTIVYKDEIMGKPVDAQDAFRMLSMLENDVHYVATGVTLLARTTGALFIPGAEDSADYEEALPSGFIRRTICDVTKVYCKPVTDEQILAYIRTGEPSDKAGAYAIQGAFGRYIDRIEGDYENVVGLPFNRIEAEISTWKEE